MSQAAERAVVLLSGGLDSATVLALAVSEGYACHTLSVDYGQRHRIELRAAEQVARAHGVVEHRVIRVDLGAIGGSALTDLSIAVPERAVAGIPSTYVPARNTLLLTLGLGWSEVLEAKALFIGANAVDYSGYPDCRPEFVAAFGQLASLATRAGIEGRAPEIRAPLMAMGKAEIIRTGLALGVDYAQTISCYQPDVAGRRCGRCDSCRLRQQGFSDAGLEDPAQEPPPFTIVASGR